MTTQQRIIDEIDPSLKFKLELIVPKFNFVYVVKKGSGIYVLKGPEDAKDNKYLKVDIKALRRTREIKEVPNLIDVYYKQRKPVALLREYVDGETIANLIKTGENLRSDLENKLKQTITLIHSKGIYFGALSEEDIIISPDRLKAHIIDFDYGGFFQRENKEYFQKECRADYENLKEIFRKVKQKQI
ncbi:MAG: hypothetical protein ABIH59_02060 [archaeon]